jgi:hypothetical protein
MGAIQLIHAHIGQSLSLGADVAVGGGIVSELVDPLEISVALGVLLHSDVGRDSSFLQPVEQFPIAIAGIGAQRARLSPSRS